MKERTRWFKRIPPRRTVFALLLAGLTACGWWTYRAERVLLRTGPLTPVDHAILRASRLHEVEVKILFAVAFQESRMNPEARGRAGEIGLFQIMPGTAAHWAEVTGNPVPSERELFRVRTNAEIAAWYLRRGLDRFDHRPDPLPFALAYYNAGPGRAVDWESRLPENMAFHEFIPFPSTRKYVIDITGRVEQGLFLE